MKNKKIVFILYDYPPGIQMMIINTIELLRKNNELTVFVNYDQHQNTPCDNWLQETIISLPKKFKRPNGISRIIWWILIKVYHATKRRLLEAISGSFEAVNYPLNRFAMALRKELKTNDYDIIIPVEYLSLIAVEIAGKYSAEVIYFDMELLDWGADNYLYRDKLNGKKLQHKALQQVNYVMITSWERAKIFANINSFDEQKISVLPVVPLQKRNQKKSHYFRDKFALPSDKTIVIYAGNLMPWAQCLEIIKSMDSWPTSAVLIIHTWNENAMITEYFKELQRESQGRPVYFSFDYLPCSELSAALASADIGLAYYENIDANFSEICFSSNKIGEYVAAGLPINVSPFPSLKDFMDEYRIGKTASFADLGNAIFSIIKNRKYYEENVSRCADTIFSFERHFTRAFEQYEKHTNISKLENTV